MNCMGRTPSKGPKEVRLNIRIKPEVKRDLAITAELRGIDVTALVNMLLVDTIRTEKEREPSAFQISGRPILKAEIANETSEPKKRKAN